NSYDDMLRHFQANPGPIGRIRILSHGWDAFLFMPVFTNGTWNFGMQRPWLDALLISDEAALRFLLSGTATGSPTLIDGVAQITEGIRAHDNAVLVPFGLQAAGPATGALLEYFELVNDRFQVQHGSIAVGTALINGAQQTDLNNSLGIIDTAIRTRLVGTTIGATVITARHLDAFRDAVLAATPVQLGMLGPRVNLAANVIALVTAALVPMPPVENDLRIAISGGVNPFLLGRDYLRSIVAGLTVFQPAVLTLGGTAYDAALIITDADLTAFVNVCVDLHHLRNGDIAINGVAVTGAERTTLRTALMAVSNLIITRIRGRGGNTITELELETLRTAIETRPMRESGITGGTLTRTANLFTELRAANVAIPAGFRVRFDAFRNLMQPGNASKVDIRGCRVGSTLPFMDTLRDFMGTAANKPAITAPDWWQSFPQSIQSRFQAAIFAHIDGIVAAGIPAINVTVADVTDSFDLWRPLIDFDAHYDFIVALFGLGASQRDFASLHWRAFRTAAAPAGIPILRIEAARIDDLPALNLDQIIERFRTIFEIPAATPPNAAARLRLNQLQPHIATFRTIAAAMAAAAAPTQPQVDQFLADLTNVANSIAAIVAPAPPFAPPAAGALLAAVQLFATAIRVHLDTVLAADLNAFFAAVQAAAAHANARIRYFYNVGLPLLVQSSGTPTAFALTTFTGATTPAIQDAALRSWMRIQWSGTAAQAAAMNAVIAAPFNNAQRSEAARVLMVSELDPVAFPASPAAIHPTPAFHGHIIPRP
ncbi:MAG TPA: hypothetical protein VGQ36_25135, partial [Thermoanaerobaculia bacterium]|nr:hypothetical protein [Thermoanaerobaculia bacterium]